MPYYSARLHVVCIVDDPEYHAEGKYTCDYPILLLQAASFESAFEKALVLGREQETIYKNKAGNDVRWALNSVEEIYELGDDLDGVEVGSILGVYEPEYPIDGQTEFHPESKPPTFSSNAKTYSARGN